MVNNDLNDINKRIEKLKIQKNILRANSEQNINRKRRTKRLIEKGALLHNYSTTTFSDTITISGHRKK